MDKPAVTRGTRLTFHGNVESINNLDIYAMNADGSGQTRLTTDAGADLRPSWQPLVAKQDSPILEGTPPAILCGYGDRAWQAGDARVVCKPETRSPVAGAPVLSR